MGVKRRLLGIGVVFLCVVNLFAATSDVADAAMKRDKSALRSLLQRKADVNVPQVDGTTAMCRSGFSCRSLSAPGNGRTFLSACRHRSAADETRRYSATCSA